MASGRDDIRFIDPAAKGVVQTEIIVVEPTCAESELLVRVAEPHLTQVAKGRLDMRHGEQIGLAIELANAFLFGPHSGMRLVG